MQDALGDGGLYTILSGAMLFVCLLIMLLIAHGARWRKDSEERERMAEQELDEK